VDEDGYPDTLLDGNFSYPFSFGAMYVFAQVIGDHEISSPVAGSGNIRNSLVVIKNSSLISD